MHRAIAQSARDHRHQLGELTSSLGSAILGHLLNLWMPPSNTGLLANTCTPEWVYRFPFGELTTSPGGFLCLRFGVKGAPLQHDKGGFICACSFWGCLGRVKGQRGYRAWGLVVAPWCVYIGQKDTQATFADVPGRDMWGGWNLRRQPHIA